MKSVLKALRSLFLGGAIPAIFILGLILAPFSMKNVKPEEVVAIVNMVTGQCTVRDTSGLLIRIPFLQKVYSVDTTAQTLHLRGNQVAEDFSQIPRLVVRASDGSDFWFEDLTIQYQAIPDEACTIVNEIGTGIEFRRWLQPNIRSILRDEFGRQTTLQVSDPTTYNGSTTGAENALNERLNHHGVRIINIDTPRPDFNEDYEQSIEARNQVDVTMDVVLQDLQRAETVRGRRIAELDQQKNNVFQQQRASFEGQLADAVATRAINLTEANAALTQTLGMAAAILDAAEARAPELQAQWDATVAETQAQIDALAANGQEAVMRRLADRMEGVTISVQPYSYDARPQSVNLTDNTNQ